MARNEARPTEPVAHCITLHDMATSFSIVVWPSSYR
jgi:hypothetical protein